MRKLLLCAVVLLSAVSAGAVAPLNEYGGSDPRITYVGRTLVADDGVTFDWSGTTVRLKFSGKTLSLRISDTDKDYYDLWIDREVSADADRRIAFSGKDTTIVLFESGGKASVHTLSLVKRTEGEQGKTTIHSVLTDGELLEAEPVKSRIIEFIGDSNTCGYGSEAPRATDPFTKETENCNKSYAAVLGRYFDADVYLIAHSGMGIVRNYNDKLAGYCMPERYLNVFDDGFDRRDDTPAWDHHSAPEPDITVIYLGSNDFSVSRQPSRSSFTEGYIRLMKEIKAFYGEDHPIVCATSRPEFYYYVEEAVESCGLKNVTFFGVGRKAFGDNEKGASSHPSYQAHRKIAHAFIPYISTLTGWPLEDKPLK